MFYDQLRTMHVDSSNPKSMLVYKGFLSEEQKSLACWSSNTTVDLTTRKTDNMLPSRFWVSINQDMLFISTSSFNRKYLSYYANIEVNNIKFIKRVDSNTTYFIFKVTNESGEYEFRINPLTSDDEYYAQKIADYISNYKIKESE